METVVTYLPAIACGAMMLLICIPMVRNLHKGHEERDVSDSPKEIAELREEVRRLKSESVDVTKETL